MIAQGAKYEILIADTFPQAKQYLYNIKTELETNELLIQDFGEFKAAINEDEWQKTSIVVPRYGTRMSAHSTGQNLRGMRHLMNRPDRVICDDIENSKTVRKKENRDKTYRWFKGDLMSVGDRGTRFFLLGNLHHSDGLMKRIETEIKEKKLTGITRAYPIADARGVSLWPGKFPTPEALEMEKRRINDDRVWKREALLQIVPEEGQVVQDEWIKRWSQKNPEFMLSSRGCGVDLAISTKAGADFTALVPGEAGLIKGNPKIYISNDIVNAHMGMHATVERIKLMQTANEGMRFFVEQVAYQQAAIETMQREWIQVDPVRPLGDKRARLETVAKYIQDGTVEFQEGEACDMLIDQILGFGIESNDDMVDACVYLILGLLKNSISSPQVIWI